MSFNIGRRATAVYDGRGQKLWCYPKQPRERVVVSRTHHRRGSIPKDTNRSRIKVS